MNYLMINGRERGKVDAKQTNWRNKQMKKWTKGGMNEKVNK